MEIGIRIGEEWRWWGRWWWGREGGGFAGFGRRLIRRGMFRFWGRGTDEGWYRFERPWKCEGRELRFMERGGRLVGWKSGSITYRSNFLGYRHYNYEINLIYILQFSLTVPPSIDIPNTITRIRKVMENQLLSAHSSPLISLSTELNILKSETISDMISNTIACAWQCLSLFFSRKKEDVLVARSIIHLLWIFFRKKRTRASFNADMCQSRRFYPDKWISTTGQNSDEECAGRRWEERDAYHLKCIWHVTIIFIRFFALFFFLKKCNENSSLSSHRDSFPHRITRATALARRVKTHTNVFHPTFLFR